MTLRRVRFGMAALLISILAGGACDRTVKPPRNVIVLCAGDSLTAEGYPRHLDALIRRDGVKARVLNYGRSGDTSGQYLGFLERHADELAACRPDVILLQLGTNDVRVDADRTDTEGFERNMRDILAVFRGFRARGGRPPLILLATIPPVPDGASHPFSPESSRRVREEINPALRRLAREEPVLLVDHFSLFEGRPGLLPDIHPSEDGYREMAENWYRAFRPALRPGR